MAQLRQLARQLPVLANVLCPIAEGEVPSNTAGTSMPDQAFVSTLTDSNLAIIRDLMTKLDVQSWPRSHAELLQRTPELHQLRDWLDRLATHQEADHAVSAAAAGPSPDSCPPWPVCLGNRRRRVPAAMTLGSDEETLELATSDQLHPSSRWRVY